MKKILLTLTLVAALPLLSHAQNYYRSASSESISGLVINANSTTNVSLNAYQLGFGGNGTVAFQTDLVAAGEGVTNVVFAFKLGITSDKYADELLYVTNVVNGTTPARYLNTINTGQARYIKCVNVQSLHDSPVTVSGQFGQHRN